MTPAKTEHTSTSLTSRILHDLDEYPHNIHPAFVPGVSIDDQKVRYGIDTPIFIGVALSSLASSSGVSPAPPASWTPPQPL